MIELCKSRYTTGKASFATSRHALDNINFIVEDSSNNSKRPKSLQVKHRDKCAAWHSLATCPLSSSTQMLK
jgi:hypothetical protein